MSNTARRTVPCQTHESGGEAWFSEKQVTQEWAARQCEDGCPLTVHQACGKQGWEHEHGVWGGLTPLMRKRLDPKKYSEAIAAGKVRSLEIDEEVVEIHARVERAHLAAEAAKHNAELVYVFDMADMADPEPCAA